MVWGGPTTVRNCSMRTLADGFHSAFHVGNTGSNPVEDAKSFRFYSVRFCCCS
jgi:hypothetical protein